jgi:hypothetical protein
LFRHGELYLATLDINVPVESLWTADAMLPGATDMHFPTLHQLRHETIN